MRRGAVPSAISLVAPGHVPAYAMSARNGRAIENVDHGAIHSARRSDELQQSPVAGDVDTGLPDRPVFIESANFRH